MSQEQRLDRLERLLLFVVRAGARERKALREGLAETGEKINALIDAQMRTEDEMARLGRAQEAMQEALAQFARRTEEFMSRTEEFTHRADEEVTRLDRAQEATQEALRAFIANTDERLNSFMSSVERLVNERREGNP